MRCAKALPTLVLLPALATAQTAAAQAVRTIPGITANTLAANDDGSTGAVNIGFTVNFFGVTKNTLFVNNNGNVTFNSALATFTPTGISTTVNQPMIAPFFADVDTRGAGSGLVKYGNGQLCGRDVFGVNWVDVGYFSSHVDKLNSFQLLLIDRSDTGPGNFDIEMNYDKILWETGDASGGTNGLGGTSVEAGYTNGLAGMARVSFQFPGSQVNGAMLDSGPNALVKGKIDSSTNGRYHFFVRNGNVTGGGGSNNEVTNQTKIFYPLRYVFDPNAEAYGGLLTINRTTAQPKTTFDLAGCLDETVTGPAATSLGPPITLVFTALPNGISLTNRSGLTASGRPYLTIPKGVLTANTPLRQAIYLSNPARVNMANFFRIYPVRVFAGAFDPTKS